MKSTQIVALILGILGGIVGMERAINVIEGFGGSGELLGLAGVGGGERAVGAIVLSIIGIIGASIVKNHPIASGILMILASIGGELIFFPPYLLATMLFSGGGVTAFVSKYQ